MLPSGRNGHLLLMRQAEERHDARTKPRAYQSNRSEPSVKVYRSSRRRERVLREHRRPAGGLPAHERKDCETGGADSAAISATLGPCPGSKAGRVTWKGEIMDPNTAIWDRRRTIRCDECQRALRVGGEWQAIAPHDCGASHFFCEDCLEKLELEE